MTTLFAEQARYFSERIERDGECWVWTGARIAPKYVYGSAAAPGRKPEPAHRFSYELHRTEIPEGLHLDHLCRSTMCVNPWHLEPVTQAENNRRAQAVKTHCPQGHEYAGRNLTVSKAGKRHCRTCHNAAEKARRTRLKEMGVKRYWEKGATVGFGR